MRVAVVGAGILGAAAAWWLARGGAEVTVFEAAPQAGGIAGAGSFAWINASWGNTGEYRALRMAAMADWAGWDVPGLGFRRTGGLIWDLPEADLRAYAAEAGAQGYRLAPVDAAGARALEPALAQPPAFALHAAHEGAVEPPEAARALVAASGARLVRGAAVRLSAHGGRVGLRDLPGFDAVVLAAGVAVPGLLADLGITLPMTAPEGWLGWTAPLPPILRGLVMAPGLHLRQTAGGRLVMGADFTGAAGAEAVAGLAEAAGVLLGRRVPLAHLTRAARPTPGDGFPVVGRLGPAGLWVMLSHSGVTLAPRLGRAVAAGVLRGESEPLLAPYAPSRFGA